MRTPTPDEIDDVLYSARVGDVAELRSALAAFAADRDAAAELSDEQLAAALEAAANETGNTALLYAAANGHMEVLSYLLPKLKLDAVLRANDAGNTAVHWAALNGHLPAVQALVQRIEELSPRPVESAAGAEDDEDDEAKAAERSPWDARNKAGRGPMSEAQMAGKEDVVKWLLERMIGGPTPSASKEEVGEDTPAPAEPASEQGAAAQPQQDAAVDAATTGVQDAEIK